MRKLKLLHLFAAGLALSLMGSSVATGLSMIISGADIYTTISGLALAIGSLLWIAVLGKGDRLKSYGASSILTLLCFVIQTSPILWLFIPFNVANLYLGELYRQKRYTTGTFSDNSLK